jgi:glycosyltransferase involved in cell wall biosynthesis
MRVALVHDWLWQMRGGERCLEELCRMFPDSDIYTLFYDSKQISEEINKRKILTSFLNEFPFVAKYYRALLPFFSLAVNHLRRKLFKEHDQNPYDLVISVSHCVAKNVGAPVGVNHLCYCLTPPRYAWDQYDRYFGSSRFNLFFKQIMKLLRKWDIEGSKRVTEFIAISDFVSTRIQVCYGRKAKVVYPPVRTDWIDCVGTVEKKEYFLCANALVPYKNVDKVIQAFNQMPYDLIVIGSGPEESRLKKISNKNIKFLGFVDSNQLAMMYKSSKALIFAAEEDFGMIPVEVLSAGTPVIAFGKGGVLETSVFLGENQTGVMFSELTSESISFAVAEFLSRQKEFTEDNCKRQARKFSLEKFKKDFFVCCSDLYPKKIAQKFFAS